MVDTSNWSPNLRLPLSQNWPSKAEWPLLQTKVKKAYHFWETASAEAVLRLWSGFRVPTESPWVGLSDGTLLVSLGWVLRSWEPKLVESETGRIVRFYAHCTTQLYSCLFTFSFAVYLLFLVSYSFTFCAKKIRVLFSVQVEFVNFSS